MNKKESQIINGLRAIAVLLIIIDHFIFKQGIYTKDTFPITFFRDGINGIFLIFITESYAVTRTLLKQKLNQTKFSWPRFYLKRLIVVVPSLYFYLFVVKYVAPFGAHVSDDSFIASLTFSFNYLGQPHHDIIMHFWAFCIEEVSILLFIPLLTYFSQNKLKMIFWSIALASILFRIFTFHFYTNTNQFDWWTYMHTHLHLFGPVFGVLLALYKEKNKCSQQFQKYKLHWLSLLQLIFIGPFIETYNNTSYAWVYKPILSCSAFAFFIFYLLNKPKHFFSKSIGNLPLAWLGKRYYSLYIWQQPFTFVYFAQHTSLQGVFIAFSLSFIVGLLIYQIIEKPLKGVNI